MIMPDELSIAKQLLADKIITEEQLKKFELELASSGKPEKELLVSLGLATEEQIIKAIGKLYKIPYVSIIEQGTSPEALILVPRSVAERFVLIPFALSIDKKELSVAFADPLDLNSIGFVEEKTGKKIKPFIAVSENIKIAINERYAQNLSSEIAAALKETSPVKESQTIDVAKLSEVIRSEPIVKIVTTVLEFALKYRASDIHIEPEEGKTRIRYRIDGILHEKLILPNSVHNALVSRIKVLTGLKIDEKRIPQDGRFNFKADNQEVDLRVSTLPTIHGEKVVMRLLRKTVKVPTLPELGLRGRALKNLEDSILRPHGIILICGPTGSGKTTTLYAVLSKINTAKVNIVTVEDPVEYEIPGVNQVQINPAAGLTFASGLRSFLRQDPNVIMVGEIRDQETAELGVHAALTGHIMLSSLHTNNAVGAIPRLIDLGVQRFLLPATLTIVISQRLLRALCDQCKKPVQATGEMEKIISDALATLPDEIKKQVPFRKPYTVYEPVGCSACKGKGTIGRIGAYEILHMTPELESLILNGQGEANIFEEAHRQGMTTMRQEGIFHALNGKVSLAEVIRETA